MIALEKIKRLLNMEEKNALVLKYQNVVHYYGYRYKHLDTDITEVKGWGFLGLAKAIHRYEEDPEIEIEEILFSTIRKEILSQYFKNKKSSLEENMQGIVFAGESEGLSLEGAIPDDSIVVTEGDIRKIIEDALSKESNKFLKINLDYLLSKKEVEQIAKENKVSLHMFNRTCKRGRILIKQYLVDNDFILDGLMTPNNEKNKRASTYRNVQPTDFGKVKFIRKFYSFLNPNDIGFLINESSYAVLNLLNDPPKAYLEIDVDSSIEQKIIQYCKSKYPERLASEVKAV